MTSQVPKIKILILLVFLIYSYAVPDEHADPTDTEPPDIHVIDELTNADSDILLLMNQIKLHLRVVIIAPLLRAAAIAVLLRIVRTVLTTLTINLKLRTD